ncbi:sensor histidine kinase, partial [bacterium]|nr:sensor histidine kinase [bacterium]
LFRQVLDNLVDNATKYARNGKARIDIDARESDGRLVLLVKDDGIGVPRSEQRKIFERFYRIEGDSDRSRKGTGLGLFVVRSIVAAHAGDVDCESEGKDRGSTFRIELPLAPPVSEDEPAPQSTKEAVA